MEILSNRILNMAESETLAMTAKARELKAQGKDVISLSIGEPDFNTPEVVKEAAKKAIDDNFTHYPPVPGYADLKEAICTKLMRDNGLEYNPSRLSSPLVPNRASSRSSSASSTPATRSSSPPPSGSPTRSSSAWPKASAYS